MKKLLVVISFVLLAGTTSLMAQTNAKLGYINTNELMQIMPGIDTVQEGIKNHEAYLTQTLQSMMTEYQAKETEYKEKVATMSQIIRQTKEKDLLDMQQRINDFRQNAQIDLQRKQAELVKPVAEKAQAAIKKVAEANGYTYVFDISSQALVIYEKGDNLMDKVKAELGIK